MSLFITFEGVEGSGKTTQIQRLKKYLTQIGIPCKVTREPGGCPISERLTGFDRYWNDAYRAARSDLRTINDYLKLFANTPLEFPPGTRHHYGNTGYVILGALIEKVSGLSYYEYMKSEIFQAAGMKDTDFYEMDLPIANCAIGYTRENWFSPDDGQLRSNQFIYGVKGSPSEHCFSTVQDIFLFFQAL